MLIKGSRRVYFGNKNNKGKLRINSFGIDTRTSVYSHSDKSDKGIQISNPTQFQYLQHQLGVGFPTHTLLGVGKSRRRKTAFYVSISKDKSHTYS